MNCQRKKIRNASDFRRSHAPQSPVVVMPTRFILNTSSQISLCLTALRDIFRSDNRPGIRCDRPRGLGIVQLRTLRRIVGTRDIDTPASCF